MHIIPYIYIYNIYILYNTSSKSANKTYIRTYEVVFNMWYVETEFIYVYLFTPHIHINNMHISV